VRKLLPEATVETGRSMWKKLAKFLRIKIGQFKRDYTEPSEEKD